MRQGLQQVGEVMRNNRKQLAARPGFEPGISAPKADVLPLHHRATLQAAFHSLSDAGLVSILPPLSRGVKGRGAGYRVYNSAVGVEASLFDVPFPSTLRTNGTEKPLPFVVSAQADRTSF